MTRNLLWVATAFTLGLSLLAYDNRSLAQQTEEASAETEATSDANADASADASAVEASGQADAQATESDNSSAQSDSQSTETQSDAQPTTSDDAQVPPPASDTQKTSVPQAAPTSDAQPAQDDGEKLSPPSTPADPNATQPGEQSRVRDPQQPQQPDAATNRDRADVSAQGRANIDQRTRRDRQNDLRVGIQFGRVTDRGLTINHIERNSFFLSSGFRRGDVIVSVHGRPVRSDADFFRFIVLQPGQRVPVVVFRDGRRETIYFQYHDVAHRHPGYGTRPHPAGGAYLGVTFDTQFRDAAVVLGVNPGSPAQEAGLQSGDILVALDGREIHSYPDAISMVRSMRPGDELEIIVERSRAERQLVAVLDNAPNVRTAARPPLEVEPRPIYRDQPPEIRVELDDRDADDRILDPDRDEDRSDRRLLPRLRN